MSDTTRQAAQRLQPLHLLHLKWVRGRPIAIAGTGTGVSGRDRYV